MFCPSCGAGEQSTDAYCKRCGEWLPEQSGLARRALWGEGVKPERRLKAILVRQGISAALAFVAAALLFMAGPSFDLSPTLAKGVAIICLLIGGMQVDGFFLALRMRRSLQHSRADAASVAATPSQSKAANLEADTAQLTRARVMTEETTKSLNSLPLDRKRVE